MKKKDVFQLILKDRTLTPKVARAQAFAPSNIALCKYWGKRNEELNLPITSSLSVSLDHLGTRTEVALASGRDVITLNGQPVAQRSPFAKGVSGYIDHFRPPGLFFEVATHNNIPTAAGLASSASGFAALTLAFNQFFAWRLTPTELSIVARLGSGSACRSVFSGFVEWQAGAAANGMDSHAVPMEETWPDLRLGLVKVCAAAKSISSRRGMRRTRRTSALYEAWPVKVAHDMVLLKEAITKGDFDQLGQVAESNALSMHATAIGAWPPVLYWLPESVAAMQRVWTLREDGLTLYFTMDAGPNLKLLFLAEDQGSVEQAFPGLEIVAPFGAPA